jgi:hypothetical protein
MQLDTRVTTSHIPQGQTRPASPTPQKSSGVQNNHRRTPLATLSDSDLGLDILGGHLPPVAPIHRPRVNERRPILEVCLSRVYTFVVSTAVFSSFILNQNPDNGVFPDPKRLSTAVTKGIVGSLALLVILSWQDYCR